jgi:TPR repeat protein
MNTLAAYPRNKGACHKARAFGLAAVSVLLVVSGLAFAEQPIVAVFEIKSEGARMSKKLLEQLTTYLSNQLTASGLYKVVPRDQIKASIQAKKKESYKSCYKQSCQIEIGKELAANKIVSTNVLKIGKQCIMTTTVYDLAKSTTDQAAAQKGGCKDGDLLRSIDGVLAKLSGNAMSEDGGTADKIGGEARGTPDGDSVTREVAASWPPRCPTKTPKACLMAARRAEAPDIALCYSVAAYVHARRLNQWMLAGQAETQIGKVLAGYVPRQAALEAILVTACNRTDNAACIAAARLASQEHGSAKATPFYRRACDRGFMDGCVGLARAFEYGYGLTKDEGKALSLYRRACERGNLDACTSLGLKYRLGSSALTRDYAKGNALYGRACAGGYLSACTSLAYVYQLGSGVAKDETKAAALYQRACDGGYTYGCTSLAYAYETGKGVPASSTKAVSLYQRACDRGYNYGCVKLGDAYRIGYGVRPSDSKAMAIYRRACELGYTAACKETAVSCPYGYRRSGSICTKTSTYVATTALKSCSPGYYYNVSLKACVRSAGNVVASTPSRSCPSGYYYSPIQYRCVQTFQSSSTSCAAGYFYSYVQKRCVQSTSCPYGFYRDYSNGWCRKQPNCPAGSYFNALRKACVRSSHTTKTATARSCPSGYYYSSLQYRCVQLVQSTSKVCPTGFYHSLVQKRCVDNTNCPTGMYRDFSNGSCNRTPSCAVGYYFSSFKKQCVPNAMSAVTTRTCPSGYHYSSLQFRCVENMASATNKACPSGYYFSTNQKRCIEDVNCPAGYARNYSNGWCAKR